MANRVDIKDADALDRFARHLTEYEGSVQLVRRTVEGEAGRTLAYLGERYRLWKRRYEAYVEEADRQWSRLEDCSGKRLDRRDRNVTIPRDCKSILDQYIEACRIRDDAKAKMEHCGALIDNVEKAMEAYRNQAMDVERRLGETSSASAKTLKSRAAKARDLDAHRRSGAALVHPGPVGIDLGGFDPLGGTSAPPAASWSPGYAGDGSPLANMPALPNVSGSGGSAGSSNISVASPAGIHETDGREGEAKEPAPDPEGAEGPVRLNDPPFGKRRPDDLNPPPEWRPGKEFG